MVEEVDLDTTILQLDGAPVRLRAVVQRPTLFVFLRHLA